MVYLLEQKPRKGVQGIPDPNGGIFKVEKMSKFGESAISEGTDVPTYKSHYCFDLNLKVSLKIDRL